MVNHPADGLLAAIPGAVPGRSRRLPLFPMKARPMTARDSPLAKGHYMGGNVETIYRWADEGINIAKVYLEETKKRGIECFYSYRISDGTSHNEFGRDFAQAHPDWVVKDEWGNAKWNFAVPEARARKLSTCGNWPRITTSTAWRWTSPADRTTCLPDGCGPTAAVSQFLRDLRAV